MSTLIGFARKTTMVQARKAFATGATVVVTEEPQGPELGIWSSTTTHTRESTTWEALHGEVKMWRNRYPRQAFYVLGSEA